MIGICFLPPNDMGTTMRIAFNTAIISLAIFGGFYQIYLKPLLVVFGVSPVREVKAIGNEHCITIPELQACEGRLPNGLSSSFFFFSYDMSRKYTSSAYRSRVCCVLDAIQSHTMDSRT